MKDIGKHSNEEDAENKDSKILDKPNLKTLILIKIRAELVAFTWLFTQRGQLFYLLIL
jgi:hypothetical protein